MAHELQHLAAASLAGLPYPEDMRCACSPVYIVLRGGIHLSDDSSSSSLFTKSGSQLMADIPQKNAVLFEKQSRVESGGEQDQIAARFVRRLLQAVQVSKVLLRVSEL
jgi:hypothetical protein